MKDPAISVIVPVYKAEKYLHRCVDSILAQTFTDIEVILVDDGSPDRSGAICNEYAARDSRVRAFHQANGGVSAARRLGVNKSKRGGYITFVDSDDALPPQALATLYAATEGGLDLVSGNNSRRIVPACDLSPDEYSAALLAGAMQRGPCAKLFRRSLFTDDTLSQPRSLPWGEDFVMNVCLSFANTKRVRHVADVVYFYSMTEGSVCETFKFTAAYAELLYQHIFAAVPPHRREAFLKGLIAQRFYILNDTAHVTPTDMPLLKSYKATLRRDIRRAHYRLTLRERLLLAANSATAARLFVFISRAKGFLTRRIKRLIHRAQA